MVYSTDRSKAAVPVLVLLFVALWFNLWGDLFYVLPCVILFLCFSVLLVLRLPRLGKRELILVLFVRLFDLCLFGCRFPLPLVSGKGCGLWLWHSLDFSLTCFCNSVSRIRMSSSKNKSDIFYQHQNFVCWGWPDCADSQAEISSASLQGLSLVIPYTINVKKIAFGMKEHTADQKIGVSVLLRLFISSNEVCNTAYAL